MKRMKTKMTNKKKNWLNKTNPTRRKKMSTILKKMTKTVTV